MDSDDDCICISAEEFGYKEQKSDVNNAKRRRFTAPESSTLEGDCQILTEAPVAPVRKAFLPQQVNDGDDIEVTGVRGQNALEDWPHSRPDCARKPFTKSTHEDYCDFCYCYVCDVKCSLCPSWRSTGDAKLDHCHANSLSPHWVYLRAHTRLAHKRSAATTASIAPNGLAASSLDATPASAATIGGLGGRHALGAGATRGHQMHRSFQNLLQRRNPEGAAARASQIARFRPGMARAQGPSAPSLEPASDPAPHAGRSDPPRVGVCKVDRGGDPVPPAVAPGLVGHPGPGPSVVPGVAANPGNAMTPMGPAASSAPMWAPELAPPPTVTNTTTTNNTNTNTDNNTAGSVPSGNGAIAADAGVHMPANHPRPTVGSTLDPARHAVGYACPGLSDARTMTRPPPHGPGGLVAAVLESMVAPRAPSGASPGAGPSPNPSRSPVATPNPGLKPLGAPLPPAPAGSSVLNPSPGSKDSHGPPPGEALTLNIGSPEWWMRKLEKAPRPPEHATPPGLSLPLKKTQRQSLGFMLGVESNGWKEKLCCPWHSVGGVLADEVGMGKTAICIALILANPYSPTRHRDVETPVLLAAATACVRPSKQPAQVTPTPLAPQEVKPASFPETKPLTGTQAPPPSIDEAKLAFAGETKPAVVGAVAPPGAAPAPRSHPELYRSIKGTLVVAPSSVLGQWKAELARFAPSLRVLWNYGATPSSQRARPLDEYDVVLTTPDTAHNDMKSRYRDRGLRHFIGDVRWHRVILDEAHLLGTRGYLGLLRARFRWGVTATPITKYPRELATCLGMVHGIKPWDLPVPDQFKQTCETKSLLHLVSTGLENCGQSRLTIDPLLPHRLSQVVVRHTKAMLAEQPEDALPARSDRTTIVDLSPDERLVYEYVCHLNKAKYSEAVRCGCKGFHFDTLIAPPLQACNNPGEVTLVNTRQTYLPTSGVKPEDKAAFEAHKRCQGKLPSKFRALQDELRNIQEQNPRGSVIILSRSLMLQERLREAVAAVGYGIIFFDGTHNATRRGAIIQQFQEMGRRQPTALCLTLKTANVGITLTAGSTVILLEPCFDPSTEEQAFGRVHRMGQTQDVQLVRLIARDTLEEKIAELCESRRVGHSGADHNDFSAREVAMVLAPMLRSRPHSSPLLS